MKTEELRSMSVAELLETFRAGTPIEADQILDSEYIGVSLGLPRFVEKLSWTTFMKVFYRDGDVARGWNVRLKQTGIGGPVRPKRSFGHFAIRGLDDEEAAIHHPAKLILDYGAYLQPPPMLLMRDPLVSLDGGRGDQLLGYSHLLLGPASIPTPSFFVLQRRGPIEFDVAKPAWPREY